MERQTQNCPICGTQIFLNHHFNYTCSTCGDFSLNYVTGELEEVISVAKKKGGCCDKCNDKGKCDGTSKGKKSPKKDKK